MRIGSRIKERRCRLNMSVDELAQKIGKDRSTVYRYESGDIGKMPIDSLEPIAKALETSVSDILGFDIKSKDIDAFNDDGIPPAQRLRQWVEEFGHSKFTDEEYDELFKFGQWLLYKRNLP